MPSESGDMKLLCNFSKLVEFVSVNPDYNPANLPLKIPALGADAVSQNHLR